MRAHAIISLLASAAALASAAPLVVGTTTTIAGTATTTALSSTCPTADNNGSALVSSTSLTGGFVQCTYQDGQLCTYFVNGDFSSGSSVCPVDGNSGTGNGTGTGATVTCPNVDVAGSPLLSSTPVDDPKGGISCQYKQARICTYFSDGSFSSGSSDCPISI